MAQQSDEFGDCSTARLSAAFRGDLLFGGDAFGVTEAAQQRFVGRELGRNPILARID
jgi:hypothetical protein